MQTVIVNQAEMQQPQACKWKRRASQERDQHWAQPQREPARAAVSKAGNLTVAVDGATDRQARCSRKGALTGQFHLGLESYGTQPYVACSFQGFSSTWRKQVLLWALLAEVHLCHSHLV